MNLNRLPVSEHINYDAFTCFNIFTGADPTYLSYLFSLSLNTSPPSLRSSKDRSLLCQGRSTRKSNGFDSFS